MDEATSVIPVLRRLAAAGDGWRPLTASDEAAVRFLHQQYGAVASAANGWRAAYPLHWLDASAFCLPGSVAVCDASMSTNAEIKTGYTPPALLACEYQYGGRGQRGAQWLALPADAITLSASFATPARLPGLSVAIGAGLCHAFTGVAALKFKWPNDILSGSGHKIAGILVETSSQQTVIGVGLNWRMTEVLAKRIAAMGTAAAGLFPLRALLPLSRQQCAQRVAETLHAVIAQFNQLGFAAYQTLAEQFHHVGVGEQWTRGRFAGQHFAGFGSDGALLTKESGRVHV